MYWNKAISAGNKYKIMKDDVQVAEVTMSWLLKQVNSGVAQERYGIGAQIIVPYTDPFDNITYDLPFNFGTFTAVGRRLGLQAHYGIPSQNIVYYPNEYNFTWYISCFRKWANNVDISDIKGSAYLGKKSFIESLPEDFTECLGNYAVMANGSTSKIDESTDNKIFLLSVTQSHAIGRNIISRSEAYGSYEDTVWEYWKQKIGDNAQSYGAVNANRIVYAIENHSLQVSTFTRSLYKGGSYHNLHYFRKDGQVANTSSTNQMRYLPACIIG